MRAVSSVLDTDVELRERRDGAWRLAVLGVTGRPRFRAAWVRDPDGHLIGLMMEAPKGWQPSA